ncbi:MAG: ABC transporter permease [Armatimonadetes bacterium]|nr:ABC transporter permease [Armatimonadota bacterium]
MRTPRGFGVRTATHFKGVVGATLVAAVLVLALVAPWVSSNPEASDLALRLRPPVWTGKGVPGRVLGTDQLGRDLWSRIAYGGRVSLLVSVCTVLLAGSVGIALGLVAGYYGGAWDRVIGGLVDIQMAFPFLLLAVAIVSAMGPGIRNVILVLALYGWVVYCRLVRGQMLALREKEFVLAARAIGCRDGRILWHHLLPSVIPAVLVISTFQVGQMIIAESALSFLGLGVQPPTPTWGGIVNEGRAYVSSAWWVTTFPGFMLMLTVIGVGFVGDWLREVFDPRLRD